MLLRFKADFDKVNNEGVSPKSLAEANGKRRYLRCLPNRKIPVHTPRTRDFSDWVKNISVINLTYN